MVNSERGKFFLASLRPPPNQNCNTKYLAQQYFEEIRKCEGVVVIHQGEVQGWVNKLRNPESWMPGCIAVNRIGKQWKAVGGDQYNGACQWIRLLANSINSDVDNSQNEQSE